MPTRRSLFGFVVGLLGFKAAAPKLKATTIGVVLGDVIWDPSELALRWKASLTSEDNKNPNFKEYTIDFKKRSMGFGGEVRYFPSEEAVKMAAFLTGVLTKYTLESTLWWESGFGTKTPEEPAKPARPKSKRDLA